MRYNSIRVQGGLRDSLDQSSLESVTDTHLHNLPRTLRSQKPDLEEVSEID